MSIWVHAIRFSFFVFKLKSEWPFEYTHSVNTLLTNKLFQESLNNLYSAGSILSIIKPAFKHCDDIRLS